MQWVWKNVFSNELHVEQLAIIGGGPLVGNLMDNFPRVPAYICLNVVQVFFSIIIYSSRVVNFPILISFFLLRICSFILLVLSGNCTVIICINDNICPYRSSYFCIIHASPSLVHCAGISRGCWKAIWSCNRGCYRAWLGRAGSAFLLSLFLHMYWWLPFSSGMSISWLFFLFVQLAGINRPIALAEANAVLSRIDLLCEVFANFIFF